MPGIQAWRAAIAAHSQAEGQLEEQERKEEEATTETTKVEADRKSFKDAVKKVNKIAATDKAAFKDILKTAVSKLLNNIGNKNSPSPANKDRKESSSANYLDDLLSKLKDGKTLESSAVRSQEPSSVDDLLRQLSERQRLKGRKRLGVSTLIATPDSFLEKLVSKQERRRPRPSRLDRLLATIESPEYYGYDDYSVSHFLESPRSFDFGDYGSERTSGLRNAMKSSERLEEDLAFILRRLERQRD